MKAQLGLGLVAIIAVSTCTGCGPNMGTVRGQNPAEAGVSFQPAGFQRQAHSVQFADPYCPPESHGHWGHGHGLFGHGHGLHGHGLHGHGLHGHHVVPGHPHHYNTYSYKTPDNLVYPPQGQPPAVVQYPYYTHKGPSDFFMK